jgi:hypothetical protein
MRPMPGARFVEQPSSLDRAAATGSTALVLCRGHGLLLGLSWPASCGWGPVCPDDSYIALHSARPCWGTTNAQCPWRSPPVSYTWRSSQPLCVVEPVWAPYAANGSPSPPALWAWPSGVRPPGSILGAALLVAVGLTVGLVPHQLLNGMEFGMRWRGSLGVGRGFQASSKTAVAASRHLRATAATATELAALSAADGGPRGGAAPDPRRRQAVTRSLGRPGRTGATCRAVVTWYNRDRTAYPATFGQARGSRNTACRRRRRRWRRVHRQVPTP